MLISSINAIDLNTADAVDIADVVKGKNTIIGEFLLCKLGQGGSEVGGRKPVV